MAEQTFPISEYSRCRRCLRFNHYGKFNCKKCSDFYSTEFKSAVLNYKQIRRQQRKNSPPELRKVYDWLRDNVFPEGYVKPSRKIIFTYKRNGSNGAWCNKNSKEIRIAPHYEGLALYETMLHEMIHLRLPHHRKKFNDKENELLVILKQKYEQQDK